MVLKMKSPEVFIVSSGRAGSTLLQSLLNASQQIYIPQESDFIARAYPFFNDKSVYLDSDYRVLASIFCATSQDDGWGLNKDEIYQFLERKKPQSFADIVSSICEKYHSAKGTEDIVWGIKRPALIASINRILSVYPSAKIIHICRDGRDVYLSYKSVHEKSPVKFGPKRVIPNALYWINGLRYIEEFKRSKATQENFLEVKYEDILNNSEETLEKMCYFIGIKYILSMIESFNKVEDSRAIAPKQLMESIHSKLSEKIDSSNTKKYLLRMTRWQIFVFELIASSYLLRYGYELEFAFLNNFIFDFFRLPLYHLARVANDIRYAYRDRRLYSQSFEQN
jgi:Sulfotransferase family